MFQLISPVPKIMALALSAALTWSSMGTIAASFQANVEPEAAQLPLVVVIAHRSQRLPSDTKLVRVNPVAPSASI
jgi:hypothetical protein